MSGIILQQSVVPIWTPVYRSVKTAGSRAMPHFCAEFKEPGVSNAIARTSQNTIGNLVGAARPTTKSTHQDSKLKRVNLAPTHSNARIVVETILPTPINACFGIIGSTGSGIRKNILRSVKIGLNQSVLKQTKPYANDCRRSQDFFTKRLQELPSGQHSSQNIITLRYHPYSRTSLVWNTKNPQLIKLWRRATHGL